LNPSSGAPRNVLTVDPKDGVAVLRGLASPIRLRILRLLRARGPMNVNDISAALQLPQSTVATNVQVLRDCELISTKTVKASKGQQKICTARFDEVFVRLDGLPTQQQQDRVVEVAMPVGLYTGCQVSAPCGLCSTDGVIGLLDVPDLFLDPSRMRAALLWFGRGWVEYKFPNNAKVAGAAVETLEFSLEMSSEAPGTNTDWPSDITLWVNDIAVGTWTSPGDFGDRRGHYTPRWWKLEGSQYGRLTTWSVSDKGCFVDGERVWRVTLRQLDLAAHHSIRLKIGIDERAKRPGGVNIFGRGFGNHDQDIVMRLHLAEAPTKSIRNDDTYHALIDRRRTRV
jgi:predicted transcriptional regulator